ncbi:MAG: DNA repair protein RecO [Clostridia bacterium]|nr:DNA repair protein RecO [Clostridia bacterium]
MEIKSNGVLLKSIDYNESDRLLTIFTAEKGKLTAGIRGVRKKGARLAFASQPFCFAEYILVQKGDKYTVKTAYLYDGFYPLRTDITRYYAASAALSVCLSLLGEEEKADGIFVALVQALKSLAYGEGDPAEPLTEFLLSTLQAAGYGIRLDGCGYCEEDLGEKPYFDFSGGCFCCENCAKGVRASLSTYHFLRKCSGLSYEEEKIAGGARRALKLLKTFLSARLDFNATCLEEFLRLYEG